MSKTETTKALEALYTALKQYRDKQLPQNCIGVGTLPTDLSAIYLAVAEVLEGSQT